MKHEIKITAILLAMFIVTQIIGLAVISWYSAEGRTLPYGMETPKVTEETAFSFLASIITAFVIAILLVFVLMNIKSVWFMRVWFFVVVVLALGITLNALAMKLNIIYADAVVITLATILAYIKIFRRNILVHNITELMIYPGVASVFIPILNIWTTILLLIGISVYDIWAVWHSGIMQKMAKFQINKLRIFSGFFVPYAPKNIREKIRLLRLKYKNRKIPGGVAKRNKLKVNLAILGGGDVVFPIIAAGVMLKTFNSIPAALIVTLFATLALLYLFIFAKKKKFYPAMPYLTAGILLGMIIGWLIFL